MPQDNVPTSTLLRRLSKTSDFTAFVDRYVDVMLDNTFSEYLNRLCEEKRLVPEHVIKIAQIDRTYGHQLFNGTRKPSRDKAIQLAFGLGMTVEEAQRLLKMAGKSPLYPKIRRDAALIFCLSKGMRVMEVQEFLASLELTLLGGNWQHGE